MTELKSREHITQELLSYSADVYGTWYLLELPLPYNELLNTFEERGEL